MVKTRGQVEKEKAASIASMALSDWLWVIIFIMGGCCSSVYSLEILTKYSAKSGNLITLAQFLVISLYGLFLNFDTKQFKLKERVIPLRHWMVMVVLFWIVSVLNNLALGYRISMPFHIIFRSGSLITSMILSVLLFSRTYPKNQVFGVVLVTLGIIASTWAASEDAIDTDYYEWLMGIGILVLAMILTAFLGQYQQTTYSTFGSQWQEGLFYIHVLSIPFFIFFYSSIKEQFLFYAESPMTRYGIREAWLYLGLNVFTQYFCISGVQKLSSMTTAVTLNLVLTIRKFVSLILSILIFQHDFTQQHMLGAALVFVGTLLYSKKKEKTD